MSAQARARAGKYQKPKRGGGKHFSRNLQPINADGEVENMWTAHDRKNQASDDDDDDSDESSEEDGSDEDSEDDAPKQDMTREQRRAAAKARKEAAIAKQKGKDIQPGDLPSDSEDEDEDSDDDAPANPNHTAKARAQTAKPVAAAVGEDGAAVADGAKKKDISQLSRREREALQAQQAKERYQKLHAEGKTDEARADLERLKLVKERRAAEAERRKAEEEERAEQAAAKGEANERERRMKEAAMGTGGKKSSRGGRKK